MSRRTTYIVERLRARKSAIERRIAQELKRPLPDSLKLQGLKRARFAIKEHLRRLLNTRPRETMPVPVRVH